MTLMCVIGKRGGRHISVTRTRVLMHVRSAPQISGIDMLLMHTWVDATAVDVTGG